MSLPSYKIINNIIMHAESSTVTVSGFHSTDVKDKENHPFVRVSNIV